jgi:hypothetical protein
MHAGGCADGFFTSFRMTDEPQYCRVGSSFAAFVASMS